MSIFYREYQSGDEVEIVRLLNILFDKWPMKDIKKEPIDYWKWKYIEKPGSDSIIVVAFDKLKLIGVAHTIPWQIKINNNFLEYYYACDTGVHPDYRRMGIYTKLNDMRERIAKIRGLKITLNPTGDNAMLIHHKKYFKKFPKTITGYVKINDLNLLLEDIKVNNKIIMVLGYKILRFLNKITIKSNRNINYPYNIKKIKYFKEDINKFMDKINESSKLIIKRDEKYLNWRYCNENNEKFVNFIAENESEILGYTVININKFGVKYPIGYIMEMFTLPEKPEIIHILLEESIKVFNEHDINLINVLTFKNGLYTNILKEHGFLDSRVEFPLFYNNLGKDLLIDLKNSDPKKLHFSWGDHDTLPTSLPDD